MRIAYLGTPAMAVPPLRALVDAGHDVALAVTAADKRRGRGARLLPTPVKAAATELGIPVSDRVDAVLELDPRVDLGVVVAFGKLIRPHVLERVPMVNVHFSLLPRWRGAAPVERAILAGDDRTGVCLMEVEEGLDTGGVYRCVEVPIGEDATADDLRRELVEVGTGLVVDALARGLGTPVPQDGVATYAAKIDAAEREIEWTRPAVDVHRLVRVGGAWTTHHGKRLKLWRTSLDPRDGSVSVPAGGAPVHLVEVQPEGKARMPARAWAHGARFHDGDRLPS